MTPMVILLSALLPGLGEVQIEGEAPKHFFVFLGNGNLGALWIIILHEPETLVEAHL